MKLSTGRRVTRAQEKRGRRHHRAKPKRRAFRMRRARQLALWSAD